MSFLNRKCIAQAVGEADGQPGVQCCVRGGHHTPLPSQDGAPRLTHASSMPVAVQADAATLTSVSLSDQKDLLSARLCGLILQFYA